VDVAIEVIASCVHGTWATGYSCSKSNFHRRHLPRRLEGLAQHVMLSDVIGQHRPRCEIWLKVTFFSSRSAWLANFLVVVMLCLRA
jgi:hypothetical protein